MAAAAHTKKREQCLQKNRRFCSKSNDVAQSWGERRGNHVRDDWKASRDKKDSGIVRVASYYYIHGSMRLCGLVGLLKGEAPKLR